MILHKDLYLRNHFNYYTDFNIEKLDVLPTNSIHIGHYTFKKYPLTDEFYINKGILYKIRSGNKFTTSIIIKYKIKK